MADEHYLMKYSPYILLGYGKSIQVIEPLALQEQLIQVTSDMLAFYQLPPVTEHELPSKL